MEIALGSEVRRNARKLVDTALNNDQEKDKEQKFVEATNLN